jgi:hypothetical protein
VRKKAEELFWELDKKYDTKFKEVCSIGKEANKDVIRKILKETRLYVPFEVLGPNDIDWEKGEIKKKELLFGAKLVASQAMLFKKMKYEGKILYGRDIRKIIQVKASFWEKLKALLIPFYIALFSLLLALFFPKRALKLIDKAIIYSIESTLFFLKKPIGQGLIKASQNLEKELKKKIRQKYKILGLMEFDFVLSFDYQKLINFDFAKKAIKLKYNWEEESQRFNRWEVLKFCWLGILFINTMNWYALLRSGKHKIILKFLFLLRVVILIILIIAILLIIYGLQT